MTPSPATSPPWQIIEPDVAAALARSAEPLELLAQGEAPAVVLRGAFPAEACQQLMRRLVDEQLLYDPTQPIPDKFLQQSIPEGYYREGRKAMGEAVSSAQQTGKRRIDIGTSLGYRGSDREDFFRHSAETHRLFARLFPTQDVAQNPIALLYERLGQLAGRRRVVTAYETEADGSQRREYGPAIIRAHYGGYTYAPHFDSVRLREQRDDYAVHAFEHQFAGVLVLQNARDKQRTAQSIIHRCLWTPDVDPCLRERTFHEYAREHRIEQVEVSLEPGDLYFFNTRAIHEVPGVDGALPRVVLATFIGYDQDHEEVFVWS
ncbi:MAG: hypothetical protein KDB14_33120 [Planctomycetales bacterium]|nr:hypothetical protein [Planctomycetales bacterium]